MDSAPVALSLCHGRLPLEGGDLLFCHELFHSLHRPRLMLLGWMGIPQDHLNLGMAQERGQRHKVNARLCRPRGPRVAKIVEPESGNFTVPYRSVMGIVHLRNGPRWVCVAREEERCLQSCHAPRQNVPGRRGHACCRKVESRFIQQIFEFFCQAVTLNGERRENYGVICALDAFPNPYLERLRHGRWEHVRPCIP